ncbi:hypothetical protein ACIF80_11560 [Streptomyces sp. NPDC085927]|uniref:hypothetical protein n=1 Tax=Streptomyces sp. NPDC085927 TaxID=3365738 RepID=UPI0037D6823F
MGNTAGPAWPRVLVAARGDGRVCAWENNGHGLLGAEPRGGRTGRPVPMPDPGNTVQVEGGGGVAFALDEDGAVRTWGRGAGGVPGDGDTFGHVAVKPVRVRRLPPIRRIASFDFSGPAIGTDGGLRGRGSALVPAGHGKGGAVRRPCGFRCRGRSSTSPAGR